MKRKEWLDSLDWREGPPPAELFDDYMPVGLVIRWKGGDDHLVGDVNQAAGGCSCCRSFWPSEESRQEIAAWALLFEGDD